MSFFFQYLKAYYKNLRLVISVHQRLTFSFWYPNQSKGTSIKLNGLHRPNMCK